MLLHSANFFSNLLTRSHQRILGSLTSKYRHAHTHTPRVAMFGRVIIESMQNIRFALSIKCRD